MIYEGTHCRLIRALGWSSVDRETDGLIGRLVIPWLLFRPSRWPPWWQADEYRGRLLVNWLASWWAGSQGASQPDPELALGASQARQPPWKASPTSSCLTAQGYSDWQRCPTLMKPSLASASAGSPLNNWQESQQPECSRVRPREAPRHPMYLQKEGCVETTLDPGCVPPERVTEASIRQPISNCTGLPPSQSVTEWLNMAPERESW